MGENWQAVLQQVRGMCLPLQPWTALIASVLVLVAGFCPLRPLRVLALVLAAVLFLIVAADFARSLLERETGYASDKGPPKRLPVGPAQIFLTAMLAGMYTLMIFGGLHLLLLPPALAFAVLLPGVFIVACLAAWHNVRLWYRQGADYEEVLNEDAVRSRELHIPPVR